MRREQLRFTLPARAYGESRAAPPGALGGDQKFDSLSTCRAAIPVAMPFRNSIANSDCSLRRLRGLDSVAIYSALTNTVCRRVRVVSVICCNLRQRRAVRKFMHVVV